MPCVVTTDLRLNEPRYVTLPNITEAKKKEIKTITFNDLNINYENKLNVVGVEEPPVRQAGVMVSSVEELVEKLKSDKGVINGTLVISEINKDSIPLDVLSCFVRQKI